MAIIALTKAIRLGRRYSRVHGWYGNADETANLCAHQWGEIRDFEVHYRVCSTCGKGEDLTTAVPPPAATR